MASPWHKYDGINTMAQKGQPEPNDTVRAPKPQGRGIVKALGQKGTTGNFKRIEAAKGKGAAIGALQNKLAKHRGEAIPYRGGKRGK